MGDFFWMEARHRAQAWDLGKPTYNGSRISSTFGRDSSKPTTPHIQAREASLLAELAKSTSTPINREALQGQVVLHLIEIDPGRIAIGASLHLCIVPLFVAVRRFWPSPRCAKPRVGESLEAFWL